MASTVDAAIRQHGFRYVAVDLRGYRLGSLNEGLRLKEI
jgi:PP-loop superfamily ATP-utilizing enzyme